MRLGLSLEGYAALAAHLNEVVQSPLGFPKGIGCVTNESVHKKLKAEAT
jgi:hypothetical protein